MRAVLALMGAMIVLAGPAHASDRADILSLIQQSIDSYNKGDDAAATPHFMKSLVIIDDLPPYHFQGAKAISDWGKSYDADSKKNAVTEPSMKLLNVTDVEISGTHAYVVWPAIYSFKQARLASPAKLQHHRRAAEGRPRLAHRRLGLDQAIASSPSLTNVTCSFAPEIGM